MAASAKGARRRPAPRVRTKVEPVDLEEINRRSSSQLPSGLPVDLQRIDEEYVPALKSWENRVALLKRMGNDAKIAGILRANILPLISASRWKVEGGDDEARELVSANLLREGDPAYWCDTSWTQRLFEMLLCLQYGVSVFGKTREIVDGLMIFRSLTYLHPESLGGTPRGPWEWNDAGTRLVAVHRRYTLPSGETIFDERIPVDDLFFAVWWMAGENWEGTSMIRPMYRSYTEKDLAARIQMIDLQNRGVGIPDVELAPGDGKKEAETLEKIARSMRGGSKERQYIVRSSGQKVNYLTSSGTVLDATPIILEKNNELASVGGTDFQQQGQTTSGSRATGSVLMVSYMQELDATRQWIQDQVNDGAGYTRGLVEELVDDNFGPVEEYPRLVGSRVSPTEQLDNVPHILDAVQKGSLLHDLEVENHVRKSLGVAPLTAEQFEKLKSANRPIPNLGGRPDSPTPTDVDEPRDDKLGRAVGLAEKKTPDANRPTSSARSYAWLESTAS